MRRITFVVALILTMFFILGYASASEYGNNGHFTLGSSKDEVLAVQGTPTSVIFNTWFYGSDYVSFDRSDRVCGYSNNCGRLKIELR